MNSKSIVAAVAGAITTFVLGYLFYGLAFAGFFEANAGSATGYAKDVADVSLVAVFVGELCGAFLLTIIFSKWANINTFASGAQAGAIFGLLVSLAFDLTMFGTTNAYNLTATLVDPIIGAVRIAIGGGVIAMMLGRGSKSES